MGAVLFKGLNGVDSKEVAKAVVVSKLASNNWKVRKEK